MFFVVVVVVVGSVLIVYIVISYLVVLKPTDKVNTVKSNYERHRSKICGRVLVTIHYNHLNTFMRIII